MNRSPINGAPIPERSKDVFFIEPIKAGERFQFRVWSPHVWGVWTHFHDSTSPCYSDHNKCVDGHDPTTLRWKAYVMGWHQKLNKPAFVQLTEACIRAWWEQLPEGGDMRGQLLALSRGGKRNSRIHVEVCQYQAKEPGSMPKDLDPRASLCNMWKLPDPGWAWTKNPLMRLADMPAAETA